MSAKHSTNKEKPYRACNYDGIKFVRTQNDFLVHMIQNHADDLYKAAPKTCEGFIKLCERFTRESD